MKPVCGEHHIPKQLTMKYSYIRINANGDIPMDFVNLDDIKKGEEYEHIRTLFSHHTSEENDVGGKEPIYIRPEKYSLWCSDGKRYNVAIYFDEDGLSKKLLPNHRINAMVDCGRFTSKKFDYIGKTRNQEIKDTWGSSYFVGDVIIKLPTGKPIPDCSIFGDNPIKHLLSFDNIKPNTRMINKYGRENAFMMKCPFATKKRMGSVIDADYWDNPEWEVKIEDYRMMPDPCDNTEYKQLLRDWGVDFD